MVTQIEPISLIFVLPQIQQQQQKAKGPLAVLAYSHYNTIKLDQGTLGLVNNEILQTTGSIQLKAEFPNKAHRLWPGELVNARLLLDTRHDGLTVPAFVVQQGPQGAYAYGVNSDSSVTIRPIKVAQISDGQALIDSGVTANEQVVVDGQYKLLPGTRAICDFEFRRCHTRNEMLQSYQGAYSKDSTQKVDARIGYNTKSSTS